MLSRRRHMYGVQYNAADWYGCSFYYASQPGCFQIVWREIDGDRVGCLGVFVTPLSAPMALIAGRRISSSPLGQIEAEGMLIVFSRRRFVATCAAL